MPIPSPRTPRCLRHHVHLASCAECQAEMHAMREQEKAATGGQR